MNNDNTVKIGVALKWRNTFDTSKRYYQENVVTACGCVFRCKVLQAQGKSPIRFTDEQGHITYTNTDIWDVLVDMAYYYNYTVDTRRLTQEMLDYAAKLDALFQKQQKEIAAIQADDKNQWGHINDIEAHNAEQQREIDSLHDTVSCFSEGIWIDTLLWSDVTIWDNNKYAITDDLQDQINVLTENHNQDIKDLTDKHNSELSSLTASIIKQNKVQDGINSYLQDQVYDLNSTLCCYGSGVWENRLHWSLDALWDNNKYAITDALAEELKTLTANHNKDVKNINSHLSASDQEFAKAVLQNASEHRLVNSHLDKHDVKIEALQTLIKEHDGQIIDLLETLTCYSYGQWDDCLKWGNLGFWENSNQMCDTFESIYGRIADHQRLIDDLARRIAEIKLESPTTLIEALRQDMITENRKTAYQIRAIGREQQAQDLDIAKIGEHFSCYADGVWGDLFIWNNDLKWANQTGVVNDALEEICQTISNINIKIEDANDDIMTNLALIRVNRQLIEGNTEDIQANKKSIVENQKNHDNDIKVLRDEALAEHRKVAYQFRAIGREQTAQNEEIAKLGEHFNCFADGVWCNLFVWGNDRLWANASGVIEEAINDINVKLNRHQDTFNSIMKEQGEHFTCFSDDVWCNSSVWNNGRLWPGGFAEFTQEIQKCEEKIQTLNQSFVSFKAQTDAAVSKINNTVTKIGNDVSEISTHIDLCEEQTRRNAEAIQNNAEAIQELKVQTVSDIESFRQETVAEHRNIAYQLRAIGREQLSQDEKICQLGEHFGCFVDGQWSNLFLWNNSHQWHNETGVIEEALSDIHVELNEIQENLANTMEEASEHFNCFGEGYWCNSSVWSEDCSWKNGTHELGELYSEHKSDVKKLQSQITEIDTVVKGHTASIAAQNSAHDQDMKTLHQEINERNFNVDSVLQAIQDTQTSHKDILEAQQERLTELWDDNSCFKEGEWNNAYFWNETEFWLNSPESLKEVEVEMIKQDVRISALENQFKLFLQQFAVQQTIIEQQKEQLETLMDCFTVLNVGKWQNLLLWDNNSKWSNNLITEAANTIGTGGASTVAVKSYDPQTATVTI